MTPSEPAPSGRVPGPRPLLLAVLLTMVEATALVLNGLLLLPALERDRLVMGATSVLFFVGYGAFLGFCAWQLRALRSWARAPIVLAQLIQILVAISFWGGSTTWVAALLVLVGAGVLVGVFHPASLSALAESEESDGPAEH